MGKIKKLFVNNGLILVSITLGSAPVGALEFSIFGNVNYSTSTDETINDSFELGELVLFAHQKIADQTDGLIEVSVKSSNKATIERLSVRRSLVDDKLAIAAGRFHTPMGYWNLAYHHGVLLEETIQRPFFLGSANYPNQNIYSRHFVGVAFDGGFDIVGGKLGYELFGSNSPAYDTSKGFGNSSVDVSNSSDASNNKAFGTHIRYTLNSLPLKIGFSFMASDLTEIGDSANVSGVVAGETLVNQNLYGVDMQYLGGNWKVLGEYFQLDNKSESFGHQEKRTGTAYYVQVSYRIGNSWEPVYRYESLDFDNDDAYFTITGAQQSTHQVLGIRYDVDESNAFKLEARHVDLVKREEAEYTYSLQWAFVVP